MILSARSINIIKALKFLILRQERVLTMSSKKRTPPESETKNTDNDQLQQILSKAFPTSNPSFYTIIRSNNNSVLMRFHVKPGAKTTEVVGMEGDSLGVRLAAPPREGQANTELIDLVAKCLCVKKHQLELVSGEKSREKIIKFQKC